MACVVTENAHFCNTIVQYKAIATECVKQDFTYTMLTSTGIYMAVASGLASPVLAGPVFTVIFKTAHAQIMNNE